MGVPLYVICLFSLFLLIFYLSLIFISCVIVCFGVFLLGFFLPGTLYASWNWLIISFPMLGKFSASNIISLKLSLQMFSQVLSLFPFWDPNNADVAAFNVVPDLLSCLHLFSFFFLYSVLWQWFPPFCPPSHLSVLLPK